MDTAPPVNAGLNTLQADITLIMATIKGREGMFKAALDSVFAQTVQPKEIIVIPDEGIDVPPGVTVVKTPICKTYARRNLAVKHIRTRWLTFFDDDDMLAPTFIEQMWAGMQADGFKHNYYYFENLIYINDDNKETRRFVLGDYTDDCEKYIKDVLAAKSGKMPGAGGVYDKAIYDNNPYREERNCCEDTFWLMRTGRAGLLHPKLLKRTGGYLVREVVGGAYHISRHHDEERDREFENTRRELS